MCKSHGGTYKGNLPVKLAHPKSNGKQEAHVDACIQPLVQAINDAGFQTLNCCCGHGFLPTDIILEDGREVIIARDFGEARAMVALSGFNILGEVTTLGDPVL